MLFQNAMPQHYHSYMEWVACSELQTMAASTVPAVVLSLDQPHVLWCNPAGAARLGQRDFTKLMGEPLAQHMALSRCIQKFMPNLNKALRPIQRLRLGNHPLSSLELAHVKKITNWNGSVGILISPVTNTTEPLPFKQRASLLAKWLSAPNLCIAILSEHGHVIAHSGHFSSLRGVSNDLETTLEGASNNDGPVFKTATGTDSSHYCIGTVQLSDYEGDYYLLLVYSEPTSSQDLNKILPLQPVQSKQTIDSRSSDIMRFVWRMDDSYHFTFISPEFQQCVDLRGAFEGRTWQDIAGDYALDPDSVIQKAIQSNNMWSGKKFTWPLPKRSMVVHVELSAMPVFNADRDFQGYRGFGVCWTDNHSTTLPKASEKLKQFTQTQEPYHDMRTVQKLTHSEQNAFDEIAQSLHQNTTPSAQDQAKPIKPLSHSVHQDIQHNFDHSAPDLHKELKSPVETEQNYFVFQKILDRIPCALLILQDGRIVYANPPLIDLAGYDSLDHFMSDKAANEFDLLSHKSDSSSQNRVQFQDRFGQPHEVRSHIYPISWQEQASTLIILEPIASNSKLNPQGWNAEDLLHILDTATEGVLMIDRKGKILALNQSAEALFGETQKILRTQNLLDLLAAESHTIALDYIKNLLSHGIISVLNEGREVIGRTAQGGHMPLFMTIGQVGNGETLRLCVVFRDIAQWKNAENALIAARQRAEKTSATKSAFLARISHEIRTPLNTIIGFADVIMKERFGPIENLRYKEYIKDIHSAGQHIIHLINDILDISKIESNQIELNFSAVDPVALLKDCIARMLHQANNAKVIIRTNFSNKLPRIVAEDQTLQQIITSLLSNAIKFTPSGGQVIVSALLEHNGNLSIKVRDTGIGMNHSDMLTAITPFNPVNSDSNDQTNVPLMSDKNEKKGLNLSLTKALVEANRASFHIESKRNEGTLVRITFPSTRVLAE